MLTGKYHHSATYVMLVSLLISTLAVPHASETNEPEERLKELEDLSNRRPVIKLNSDKFRKYIGSKSLPRNYSFVVMMTALSPHRGCFICRQAYEEFLAVATSYRLSEYQDSKRLYFGSVDYDEGQDVFNLLGLTAAPAFLYFNEQGKIRSPDELNIQRSGFSAETIARWLADKTGDVKNLKIVRPPNYVGLIIFLTMGLATTGILYASRNSLAFLMNRYNWGFVAVAIVFFMTSGQMWNQIRGAPFMQKTREGIAWIHAGSSGQYVIETYLVLFMNMAVAGGILLLINALNPARHVVGGAKQRRIEAISGIAILLLSFSLLLSTFRQKSYGYPYSLLLR
ncbi:Magnesium transporter protein 1 [Fragariocoptes setiger]|uniref:Magnesium transporter protein 1 n=1 Tax=Fragariocoptes setiger TaxID=1670756 RepID=A0ABQ7S8C4_9ACAR|nr:Magnesium transporter protein 1 [Fragariocoptes setiger]